MQMNKAVTLCALLLGFQLAAGQGVLGAEPAMKPELLTAPNVAGIFLIYQVDPSWVKASPETRERAVTAAKAILSSQPDKVLVQGFLTRGLTPGADFMLSLHSKEATLAQAKINKLIKSEFGSYLREKGAFVGMTGALKYIHKNPGLLKGLKAGKYDDPTPKYALMLPVKKTAEWWNLPFDERLEMIEKHTVPAMDYLKTVNRKLYHTTGLGDYDFLTFFTCARPMQFNELVIKLRSVQEGKYTTYGNPVILGTVQTLESLFNALK